ncbi:hypothetical protein PG991_003557 [Apiospora marii]|uniref:G domain-containing protein n=1 Tax=Apiospora marii TaxID=335849 RepID=A0ABR1S3W6_9PEZI
MADVKDEHTAISPGPTAQAPELGVSDIVIAVMGVTGSGKSTFVSQLVGEDTAAVTCAYEFHRPGQGSVHIVDTPGFDDTYTADAEVLRDIAAFMTKTYQSSVKLAGIIYLHRITDNRVSGSALRNLRMFKELCGQDVYKHVILATSMWNKLLEADKETAVGRERELRWYADDKTSADDIIDALLAARNSDDNMTLQIQRELVDERKDLVTTSAGKEVNKDLAELQKRFDREMQRIIEESRMAVAEGDIRLHEQLQLQKKDFEDHRRKAAEGQKALQVSFQALLDQNAEKYRQEHERLLKEFEATKRSYDELTSEGQGVRAENDRLRGLLEGHGLQAGLTDSVRAGLEGKLDEGEKLASKIEERVNNTERKRKRLMKILTGFADFAVGVALAVVGIADER